MRRLTLSGVVFLACAPTVPLVGPSASGPGSALAWVPKTFSKEVRAPGKLESSSLLVRVLADELGRSVPILSKSTPPFYYAALGVTDVRSITIRSSSGALVESGERHQRKLDVDFRVGSAALDNTHPRAEGKWASTGWLLPVEDDALPLARGVWQAIESARREAAREWGQVQAELRLSGSSAAEELTDFDSPRAAVIHLEAPATLVADRTSLESWVRSWSAELAADPGIETSSVEMEVSASTRTLVTSEGTQLQIPETHARIYVQAETSAADGAVVSREGAWDARTVAGLPEFSAIQQHIQALSRELLALRKAPQATPFVGPVVFEGRAAAIVFHEVLGHRLEGNRLRNNFEGGTFADRLGQSVMPRGFDVYDDPTLERINGQVLLGSYAYDDEGTRAQRASLISDGVLVGFLSTRAPVPGMPHSNAHARREAGYRPFSRQANLIVEPRQVISREALTQAFLQEIRTRKADYGLRVVDAAGGSTTTERGDAQTFRIQPTLAYRVSPDGHEELVRGITLEGTPLAFLGSMVAAANSWGVFDGVCGAESGFVPVASVSPAVLVRSLEVTRDDQGPSSAPLLPSPRPTAGPPGGGTNTAKAAPLSLTHPVPKGRN